MSEPEKTEKDSKELNGIKIFFLLIGGLVAPPFLVIVVRYGYAPVLEEAAKALFIFFIIRYASHAGTKIVFSGIFGLLFGISESFFYLNGILQSGSDGLFLQRMISTIPMHIATAVLVGAFAAWNRWLIFVGIFLAAGLHVLFNFYVVF